MKEVTNIVHRWLKNDGRWGETQQKERGSVEGKQLVEIYPNISVV